MTTELAPATNGGAIIEQVITKGDLSKLTPEERVRYYRDTCTSLGLNPLTRPLEYITLNGKLTLYARRDAADQLRKLNGISVEVVSREVADGILTVHVRAKDASGRTDEDFGCVNIASMKGEFLANATMKAVTKAKRRVTLSISGLGLLDETEVADIPAAVAPTMQPHGGGFRLSGTPTPDPGRIVTQPSDDAIHADDPFKAALVASSDAVHDGELETPDPRAEWLSKAIAEVKLLGKGARLNWSEVNKSHIAALTDAQREELRAAMRSAQTDDNPMAGA